MQYTENLKVVKNENFSVEKNDIFFIFAQNIDCGYTLQPLHRVGSNEYPQSMILAEISRIVISLQTPGLLYESEV